jgi:hypothetical protein
MPAIDSTLVGFEIEYKFSIRWFLGEVLRVPDGTDTHVFSAGAVTPRIVDLRNQRAGQRSILVMVSATGCWPCWVCSAALVLTALISCPSNCGPAQPNSTYFSSPPHQGWGR